MTTIDKAIDKKNKEALQYMRQLVQIYRDYLDAYNKLSHGLEDYEACEQARNLIKRSYDDIDNAAEIAFGVSGLTTAVFLICMTFAISENRWSLVAMFIGAYSAFITYMAHKYYRPYKRLPSDYTNIVDRIARSHSNYLQRDALKKRGLSEIDETLDYAWRQLLSKAPYVCVETACETVKIKFEDFAAYESDPSLILVPRKLLNEIQC